jgi:glycosyltransferase involved in cell wall biosynthesis
MHARIPLPGRETKVLSAPLRIALLLNPFTLLRKGGDHAPELARELTGLGHTVRVFGPGATGTSRPAGQSGSESALEPLVPRRFAPDAILAYDALSPAAWLGARTARALSVPLLLVESGSRSDRGGLARLYQGAGEMLWGRYVRHTASVLVALDPIARTRALASGFPEERVVVLPTGVDPHQYCPGLASRLIQQHHIRGRILLYVGRIERNRGLEVLVQAFARTVGQRDDWSLVLVGEGGARAETRALIDRLGIGSSVHWLGRVREEELPGLFSASTLLGVPALDDSVRGKNVARAMASGLPVLVSDRPGLRSLVEHEASGLVVPPGDLSAWTEALRRASMSPDARRRWGRRAREIAESRLSWSSVARAFESMILRARGAVAVESGAGRSLDPALGAEGAPEGIIGAERG